MPRETEHTRENDNEIMGDFFHVKLIILHLASLRDRSDTENSTMLPPLYEMDDYDSCIQNQGLYCKVQAVLKVPFSNTSLLEEINEYILNKDKFDRSIIHRAICLSTSELSNNEPTNLQLSKLVNQKIEDYNLTAEVDHHICLDGKFSVTTYDSLYLYLNLVYLFLVIFATFFEAKNRNKKSAGTESILSHFSLVRSWKSRTMASKNDDYNKLLSMQGLRIFHLLYIIGVHMILDFFFIYIKNLDSFEKQMETTISLFVKCMGIFVVLPFFVFSSWLSTIQVYNIFEKHGQFTIKHIGVIIINRYFRMIAAISVPLLATTVWFLKLGGPLNYDLLSIVVNACRKNLVYNVFHINNFLFVYDLCNPVSWYLAADFQMYIINILVMYLILKFNLNEYKAYGSYFMFCCFLNGIVLYYYNFNKIVFFPSTRNLESRHFMRSLSFLHEYTSTISIASSSCLGMILGVIYLKHKNRTINFKQHVKILWNILFIGLPILAIILSCKEYGRLEGAVLGSLVKPMYALGSGIGILGMSHNLGGFYKIFLENKYVVLLGNFTFCTFFSHMFIHVIMHSYSPPQVDYFTLVTDFIIVTVCSFSVGILITLVIEEPCMSLQKKILPQIKKINKVKQNKKF